MAADDLGNPLKKKHGKGAKRFLPPQTLPVAGGALAVLAAAFIWMSVAGNRGGGEPFAIEDGIVGDREGLALYRCSDGGGYLLLSSQGNSSFKIYDRRGNAFLATIAAHADLGTDGLDVTSLPAGDPSSHAYRRGMLVAQDDVEKRFHLYDFEQIAASVGLPLCP